MKMAVQWAPPLGHLPASGRHKAHPNLHNCVDDPISNGLHKRPAVRTIPRQAHRRSMKT